jgi:hypothetical protein
MNARTLTLSCVTSTLLALAAATASANDGVPPEIFDLVQEGQDVVVTFGIVEPGGEPGIGSAFDLTRSGPEGEVAVFANESFDPADGEARDPWCRIQDSWGVNGVEEECAAHPDTCEDCDGDDALDCPTASPDFDAFCAAYLVYEVVDHCVPAGATDYELKGTDTVSDYLDAEGSIDVVDSGGTCGPGDSSVDCSVSGVGARGGALPAAMAILMGLVGLVGLRARRKG